MSQKYVEVHPNKIILSRAFNQSFYEAKVTLTNTTSSYIVFKVYINKSTQYSSNPSTGFIKPSENITVTIKRIEKVYSSLCFRTLCKMILAKTNF